MKAPLLRRIIPLRKRPRRIPRPFEVEPAGQGARFPIASARDDASSERGGEASDFATDVAVGEDTEGQAADSGSGGGRVREGARGRGEGEDGLSEEGTG